MLLFLERLNFVNLLNATKINDKLSMLAAKVYRCKYSHLRIVVTGKILIPHELNKLLNEADMQFNTNKIDRIFSDRLIPLNINSARDIRKHETRVEITMDVTVFGLY